MCPRGSWLVSLSDSARCLPHQQHGIDSCEITSGAGLGSVSIRLITFSNSLIESWWRVLKHQWLYLNTLDTVTTVRKLVAFYIE